MSIPGTDEKYRRLGVFQPGQARTVKFLDQRKTDLNLDRA
jgi:hypothetical protein